MCRGKGESDTNNDSYPKEYSLNWDSTLPPFGAWFDNTGERLRRLFADEIGESWKKPFNDLSYVFNNDSLVAYRAPSNRQYDECKTQGGRSVWTEDGIWRCLFKGQKPPGNLTREFSDLTGFLDYQRDLTQKMREEAEARRKQRLADLPPAPGSQTGPDSIQSIGWPSSPNAFSFDNPFPGTDKPKLISEEEAKGKTPVWQSENTEAVTLEDGSLERRSQLVKYFDDGTAVMKQSSNKNPSDSSDASSKSWFWK